MKESARWHIESRRWLGKKDSGIKRCAETGYRLYDLHDLIGCMSCWSDHWYACPLRGSNDKNEIKVQGREFPKKQGEKTRKSKQFHLRIAKTKLKFALNRRSVL